MLYTDGTMTEKAKELIANEIGVSDLKNAVSFVKNGYVETWERGSITTNTGADTSSTNRCRSVGYISFLFSGAVSFHVKSGDKVSYREYTNTSGGFVAKTYDWKTSDFPSTLTRRISTAS